MGLPGENGKNIERVVNYSKFSAYRLAKDLGRTFLDEVARREVWEEYRVNKRLILNGIRKLDWARRNADCRFGVVLRKVSGFVRWAGLNSPRCSCAVCGEW